MQLFYSCSVNCHEVWVQGFLLSMEYVSPNSNNDFPCWFSNLSLRGICIAARCSSKGLKTNSLNLQMLMLSWMYLEEVLGAPSIQVYNDKHMCFGAVLHTW
jgi:hypothetical protein